ncbi:MAG: hypothetical protein QOE45_637 [Frankiaceae bacterium]|nr:hypothetical protein [Frankiaceae bacterium]
MTVRVALVGCGAVARRQHLPGYRAGGDADVTVFASRSRESAEAARDEWGSGDVVTGWHDVLDRDDVDAVDVCLPNALHAEVAVAALDAGKHVLVEKPLATTLADADAMLAAAGARRLAVAFDLRCVPSFVTLRAAVASGRVGRVRRIDATLGHPGPEAWAPASTWFRDPALSGGGCLMDLGAHLLDAVAVLGGPVVAISRAQVSSDDDEAEVLAELPSGATATVRVSWRLAESDVLLRVEGEDGTLTVTEPGEPAGDAPATAAGAFARALARGEPLPADGRDGRAALAAVLAAYESARTGRRVAVG